MGIGLLCVYQRRTGRHRSERGTDCRKHRRHSRHRRQEDREIRTPTDRTIQHNARNMKRVGYLTEQIADLNNLTLAFYKAAKGKIGNTDVKCYRRRLPESLDRLRGQILSGQVDVGKYHYFKIYDPKERMICAAAFDERVLHHALMNVCHPFFERQLIYDTYATRIGKGTYKALERASQNIVRYKYVAKLDMRKYFDSIPHDILLQKLERLFKDNNLLGIFERIIRSYHSPVSMEDNQRGIPIGNLTSQYFANYYLSETDHFAKEQLRVPCYIRYMDDMLLMGNDKAELKAQVKALGEHVRDIGLELKPVVLNKSELGVSFLGYKLYPHRILLNRRSKQRLIRKTIKYDRLLNQDIWTEQEYRNHIVPLMAFAQHAYTKRLRTEILEGSNRVLRGGSWNNNAGNCRVANRNYNSPDNRNSNYGFRLSLAHDTVSDDHVMNRKANSHFVR